MILTLITRELAQAGIAVAAGIDRVMIDLEIESKRARQSGRPLFLSDHCLEDVAAMRSAYPTLDLTVRIDSFQSGSMQQIRAVSAWRPQRIMLPFITTYAQVEQFLEALPTGVAPVLLLENRFSLTILPRLLREPRIGEVFIGLNDLSLDLGFPNLACTVVHPSFREAVALLNDSDLTWGFGGIGAFTDQRLPIVPEDFYVFQLRLGSRSGWLSRSFRRLFEQDDPERRVRAAVATLKVLAERHAQPDPDGRSSWLAAFDERMAGLAGSRMY